MNEPRARFEEFKVSGDELLAKAKELVHEGNVRRLIIKNDAGQTLIEVPLTVGAVAAVVAAPFVAIGAIAALATRHTIVVERIDVESGQPSLEPAQEVRVERAQRGLHQRREHEQGDERDQDAQREAHLEHVDRRDRAREHADQHGDDEQEDEHRRGEHEACAEHLAEHRLDRAGQLAADRQAPDGRERERALERAQEPMVAVQREQHE